MKVFEFFMRMVPPTITQQEKKISFRTKADGSQVPVVYEPPELKAARAKLTDHLAGHVPPEKLTGPIELVTKWCFPAGRHRDGEYRITRPDTDNLQKMLKDCMTQCGFWKDDALVCREITEKFWAEIPGIYIRITEME